MKNQLFNNRIPTIFVIGFIVLGIVLTTVIVRVQTNLRSSAGNSEEPKNVKITNLSDDSFTITYQTDAATIGSINYGSSKQLGSTQLENLPKNVHSLTVAKLAPDTKYYLSVNNGALFEVLTGPELISSPSASEGAIKGKIILPDGNAPNEALVYLNTNNSQLLSTTVTKDGEFNFSLKELRTDDLSSYLEIDKDSVLKLFAIGNSLQSTVLLSGSNNYLVPTITLSNDYDFTKDSEKIASESAQFGFPLSATPSATSTPTPTPTTTPIPTVILIPTLTPTPFVTSSQTLESKGGLEPTGNSSILLIIGGIVTTISGIALFLLTRTIL